MLAASRPIDAFATWLPQETVTYAVTGGADLQPLYTFLEQSIRETGPLGEKILALPGVADSRSYVVMEEVKETMSLPLFNS